MIALSRSRIIALAAIFSSFHLVLGITALNRSASLAPPLIGLVLYAGATVLSLSRVDALRLPTRIALLDLAVALVLPLLCDSQLDANTRNGYATWYVAGIGALLTILAVRGNTTIAWLGMAWLALETAVWGGFSALTDLGVIGSMVWILAAMIVTYALQRTEQDVETLAKAERQTAMWHAEHEAHVVERRRRLEQSYTMAEPLLTEIVRRGGVLDEDLRDECLLLESTMRDEIRGRGLLDDAVRSEVERARRRGAAVSLLDEGGLDELDAEDRARILARLAAAIAGSRADSLIVRSLAAGSPAAVTVVGLKAAADPGEEDDVELWLEIPRTA